MIMFIAGFAIGLFVGAFVAGLSVLYGMLSQ